MTKKAKSAPAHAKGAPFNRYVVLAAAALVGACAGDSTPLRVIPVEPSASRAVAGDRLHGTVGEPVPDSLAVRVTDRYSNPVPGVRVRFTVREGEGTVSPEVAVTGADGMAYTAWTLGTRAGPHEVVAEAEGTLPVRFTAYAAPDAPDREMISGDGQYGLAGMPLAEPLAVQVWDRYGNPIEGLRVAWEVTKGGGRVDPATSATDSAGVARTRLTLGPDEENVVTARIEGRPEVTFRAFAGDEINLSIVNAYLVQSVQRPAGDVPLVAGRDAMLRIFVVADQEAPAQPEVQVDFYVNGSHVGSERVSAPRPQVPVKPREDLLNGTWNLLVPGARIVPGLAILVTVNPDGSIPERDGSDNTFPASGQPLPIDVRVLDPFRVVLVPIRLASSGKTGDVSADNAASYLADALAMFPLPSAQVRVHAPFTPSPASMKTAEDWTTVLHEIRQLRASEADPGYYYGIAPAEQGPYCGLGYIGVAVAVGLDICGGGTAAHEWGHNFGRLHAPCGGPADPDAGYPYPEASIGVYGFDVAKRQVRVPSQYYDLMSYCDPAWISDYTYEAVLDFRASEKIRWDKAARGESVLMVWGRIDGDVAVLEPAYEIDAPAALPMRPGPYRLQGLDAAGGVVFELSFEPDRLGHGPDSRHFSFAVPASVAQTGRLERLRLIGPGGVIAERSRQPAVPAAPAPRAEAAGPGRMQVRWNDAGAPLVVVRDAATGQILSFARGGAATIWSDARHVELIVSDGVANRSRERVEVQR